jgi:penicillin-binding protein 1A
MRLLLRFAGLLFAAGTILFIVAIAGAAGLLWHFSRDLPDYSQLQDYEPAVMTRVHASDGALLAEYARERRLYIPIQAVPKLVINAFVAAEDKNFYEHGGIDFSGIARAATVYIQNYGSGRRPQGASTITQQVAKNFLLTNELSWSRRLRRGRGVAALLRQVGARIDRLGGCLSGGAAEGAEQLPSIPAARARLRAPQLRPRPDG